VLRVSHHEVREKANRLAPLGRELHAFARLFEARTAQAPSFAEMIAARDCE
jgi:hypothetical protein